ncbi:MAG: hypothetical protein N5P05_003418 [Chroococcopsis gigantea SAG 12.99]|jgi:uncharacterized membrane protein YfcA|nr:sulfite exporter TauE/SafE family protein [Chlorogloea purpurea SAG 13.99]MDV3001812.1 hypothetical protein [Chroococcopsis gigantea SAG 12.99]
MDNWLILVLSGVFSGLLAGLLGIGGGTVLVPILITLKYSYAQSVATSSLAIVITSISGTFQNWRMGYISWRKVILLGIPGIVTAFMGGYIVGKTPKYILEGAFAILLMSNIYLTNLRQKLVSDGVSTRAKNPAAARIFTGGLAGLLAGVFGVGGGVIMVPLQMLLLAEPIKLAIQTSLAVIMITSISACAGHAREGNVLYLPGLILGLGGLVGAQISTRYLPKFSDKFVRVSFCSFLVLMAIYFLLRAWFSYEKL